MTEREKEVIEIAILWRQATKTVERALLFENFRRAIDLLIKERRNSHAKNKHTN